MRTPSAFLQKRICCSVTRGDYTHQHAITTLRTSASAATVLAAIPAERRDKLQGREVSELLSADDSPLYLLD